MRRVLLVLSLLFVATAVARGRGSWTNQTIDAFAPQSDSTDFAFFFPEVPRFASPYYLEFRMHFMEVSDDTVLVEFSTVRVSALSVVLKDGGLGQVLVLQDMGRSTYGWNASDIHCGHLGGRIRSKSRPQSISAHLKVLHPEKPVRDPKCEGHVQSTGDDITEDEIRSTYRLQLAILWLVLSVATLFCCCACWVRSEVRRRACRPVQEEVYPADAVFMSEVCDIPSLCFVHERVLGLVPLFHYACQSSFCLVFPGY